jgi:hypothetical protein
MKHIREGFRVRISHDVEAVRFNQAEWRTLNAMPSMMQHGPSSVIFQLLVPSYLDDPGRCISIYDVTAVVVHICHGNTIEKHEAILLGRAAIVSYLCKRQAMAGVIVGAMPSDEIPF